MKRSLLHSLLICALVLFLCAVSLIPLGKVAASSSVDALYTNAIRNPGAEDGTYYWDDFRYLQTAQYGAYASFPELGDPGPADRGQTFFWGDYPYSSPAYLSQLIYLSSDLQQLIYDEELYFELSGYLGGYETEEDNARFRVIFKDQFGQQVGSAEIGPVTAADRKNQTGLLYRSMTGKVPVDTMSAEVVLTITNATTDWNQNYNFGYADNLSLTFQKRAVYLPFAVRPAPPPEAPSNLNATPGSSSAINLSWYDNSNNESGFQIERAPINTSSFTLVKTTSAGVTAYTDSGLTPSTGYSYRVRAINAAGASAYTAVASATTLVAAPAAPTGLNASGTTATSTILKWTDNASNETGFELERYIGGIWVKIAGTDVLGPNSNQRTVTGLASQTTYKFHVRAVNQGGYSAWSNEVSVTTLSAPVTIPAAPSNLTYSNLTATTVKLSWVDNANNETWFDLQESVNGGAWTTISSASSLPANYTYANVTDLLPDTNHSYRIRAVNSAGSSAFSNTVNFQTPAVPQTKLRVVNDGTVDFIISLKINNVEYLPTWDKAIAPGASADIPVNPGAVTIVATTGWWDTQSNPPSRFSKYNFTFSGTIDPGTTETITVENPAIEFLLTTPMTLGRRAWVGTYWAGTKPGYYTFCFYDNKRWRLYNYFNGSESQIGIGNYAMQQYGFAETYFILDDDDEPSNMTATLNMIVGGGEFYFRNGPSGWEVVTYVVQTDSYTTSNCPATAP